MAHGQAQGHLLGNRYRLETVVGRGGMGTVWQAYDVMLDREVAVKEVLLPPGLSPSDRDVLYQRTFREARASARLNHPSVVTVHDVVEEAGRPWIVMEYVRARSLQDLIDEGPVPPRRAAEIGRQTLAALRHAHEKGILHRDVKPSNVLITGDERAVLTDFGIAQVEGDATLTQTGLVMGSPAYIPPERAQGERAVPASDLWSLGATLYAAVEGRSPYERSDAMASLAAALSEPVPPPRNAGPLREVLEGLLAREPRHRMTADRALPLLAEVAARQPEPPMPPMRDPTPTAIDETQLDEPHQDTGARYGPPPPLPPEVGETVLDSAEVEAATRQDTGGQPDTGGEARTLLQSDWAPPPYNPMRHPPRGQRYPQQQPADPARRERTRTIVIVAIAVILVVAAVLAGAFILRKKMNEAGSKDGGDTSVTNAAGKDGGAAVGYRRYTESGFSVEVPSTWTRVVDRQRISWHAAGGLPLLQIDRTPWEVSPLQQAHNSDAAAQRTGSPFSKDYARRSIVRLAYQGAETADWDFTWTDGQNVRSQSKDRFFRVGGKPFAIYFRSTAADWNAHQPFLTRVYSSFKAV